MEKKTIVLELPCELIDEIDRLNTVGDRSSFISHLLEKQVKQPKMIGFDTSTELTTRMSKTERPFGVSGEIGLVDSQGVSLGKFDINTIDGFKSLVKKIKDVSEHPIVKMRAERWL